MQFASSTLRLPAPQILSVLSPLGRCLVDTCSDVSVARRDVLTELQQVTGDRAISVGHLGGETLLEEAGVFEMASFGRSPSIYLTDVYVVEPEMLLAGVVALLGVTDIRELGLSLDAVMLSPGNPWEQSVSISVFTRIRRTFRRCFGIATPPERRTPSRPAHFTFGPPPEHQPATRNVYHGPPPEDRPWRRAPMAAPPRRPVADPHPRSPEEDGVGQALLEATRADVTEEQHPRTANCVAQLFTEGLARKRALKDAQVKEERQFQSSSWSPARLNVPSRSRKRSRFYAVRKGRNVGIFHSWEECERQVSGVASEHKSFGTFEEAQAYLRARRTNYMIRQRPMKRGSSFVGGSALRAELEVWQDGFADSLRVECALDTASDVNFARIELLHDVHDVISDEIRTGAGKTEFTREGILKVLYHGEVLGIPALVATTEQLPRSCDALLGIPGLDGLGVSIDEHRKKQRQPLMCFVGEKGKDFAHLVGSQRRTGRPCHRTRHHAG